MTMIFIGASNGDTMRNRLSPYVRFTITDPETQQITAAGQIPLNSPPLSTQANTSTSNSKLLFVFSITVFFYTYILS